MKNAIREGQDQAAEAAAEEIIEAVVVGNEESGQASPSSTTTVAATDDDDNGGNDNDTDNDGLERQRQHQQHRTSNSNIETASLQQPSSLPPHHGGDESVNGGEEVPSVALNNVYSNDLANINTALDEEEQDDVDLDEDENHLNQQSQHDNNHQLIPARRSRNRRSRRSVVATAPQPENTGAAGDWFVGGRNNNEWSASSFAIQIFIAAVAGILMMILADIIEGLFRIPAHVKDNGRFRRRRQIKRR